MGRRKDDSVELKEIKKPRPALTPEGRMNQLTAIAIDRVEERMINGTASAAEYVHFLKYASLKERKEIEKLEYENQLLIAKTESIKAQKDSKDLYAKAIRAMGLYSGHGENFMEGYDDEEL